jgi:hypothetical protein
MIFNQYEASGVYFKYINANIMQYNGAGIGVKTSTTPVEALEVNGNIELQASANEYLYATPRNRILNIHGSAFEHYPTTTNSTAVVTVAFASGSSRSISGGTTDADYMLVAPVILPDGAAITSFVLYAWDNSATYEITGELCRETIGATAVTVIASSATGTTSAPNSMTAYPSSAIVHTVDNATYVYFVRVKLEEGFSVALATTLRLGYVQVQYTVSKAQTHYFSQQQCHNIKNILLLKK